MNTEESGSDGSGFLNNSTPRLLFGNSEKNKSSTPLGADFFNKGKKKSPSKFSFRMPPATGGSSGNIFGKKGGKAGNNVFSFGAKSKSTNRGFSLFSKPSPMTKNSPDPSMQNAAKPQNKKSSMFKMNFGKANGVGNIFGNKSPKTPMNQNLNKKKSPGPALANIFGNSKRNTPSSQKASQKSSGPVFGLFRKNCSGSPPASAPKNTPGKTPKKKNPSFMFSPPSHTNKKTFAPPPKKVPVFVPTPPKKVPAFAPPPKKSSPFTPPVKTPHRKTPTQKQPMPPKPVRVMAPPPIRKASPMLPPKKIVKASPPPPPPQNLVRPPPMNSVALPPKKKVLMPGTPAPNSTRGKTFGKFNPRAMFERKAKRRKEKNNSIVSERMNSMKLPTGLKKPKKTLKNTTRRLSLTSKDASNNKATSLNRRNEGSTSGDSEAISKNAKRLEKMDEDTNRIGKALEEKLESEPRILNEIHLITQNLESHEEEMKELAVRIAIQSNRILMLRDPKLTCQLDELKKRYCSEMDINS